MGRPVIFLDDGGVMNDNRRRGPAWQRLVAEFFAPRLGGDPAAWAAANKVVAEHEVQTYAARWWGRTDIDTATVRRVGNAEWLGGMCALVGAPPPPEEEVQALTEAAMAFISRRVQADFPGAVAAIRTLHRQGYALHTASGEWSCELDGYLTGMGVRDCFDRLYGPDLIDTLKEGPAYYARLLDDAGVAPAEALIVDDTPLAIEWAATAGARTVLVGAAAGAPMAAAIGSLAELPAALARLGWG